MLRLAGDLAVAFKNLSTGAYHLAVSRNSYDVSLPPVERALIAARIVAGLETCFAHWEAVPEVDLWAGFREFVEQGFAARDRFEFDLVALTFMAKFRNGHTGFSDAWLWQTHGAELGFDARPIGDDWFVTSSARPGLAPGSRSGGSSGQPYVESLGNGMQFWIGAKRQYLPDGTDFEGRGLEPDIPVSSGQRDIMESHDRTLEVATRHLTGRHVRTPLS